MKMRSKQLASTQSLVGGRPQNKHACDLMRKRVTISVKSGGPTEKKEILASKNFE